MDEETKPLGRPRKKVPRIKNPPILMERRPRGRPKKEVTEQLIKERAEKLAEKEIQQKERERERKADVRHYTRKPAVKKLKAPSGRDIKRDVPDEIKETEKLTVREKLAAIKGKFEKTGESGKVDTTVYTLESAEKIIAGVAQGKTIERITDEAHDLPSCSVVYEWIDRFEDFARAIHDAKQRAADKFAMEIIELADADPQRTMQGNIDQGHVSWTKLRIESRKWVAAKLKPKQWGERVETTINATLGLSSDMSAELREKRIMELANKAGILGEMIGPSGLVQILEASKEEE